MKFTRCLVPNSICGPSRATVLTGKYSHMNGFYSNVAGRPFDGTQQTFPKLLLQKAGYQTALIGKWLLESDPTGFDHWHIFPGQGIYYNPPMIRDGEKVKHEGYCTDLITDFSIEWLRKRDKSKPFLLMSQHKAPHREWSPALRHLDWDHDRAYKLVHYYKPDIDEWELYDLQANPAETRNFIADPAYAKTVAELKVELNRLRTELRLPPLDQEPCHAYGKAPFDAPGQPRGERNAQ